MNLELGPWINTPDAGDSLLAAGVDTSDPQWIEDFGCGWLDGDRDCAMVRLRYFALENYPNSIVDLVRTMIVAEETEADDVPAWSESTLDTIGAYANILLAVDQPVEDDASTAEVVLEELGDQLGAGERNFLERFAKARLSLYEIIEVAPDRGVWVQDLLPRSPGEGTDRGIRPPDDIYFVHSWAYEEPVPFSLVATRILRRPGVGWISEGEYYDFLPTDRDELLSRAQTLLSDRSADGGAGGLRWPGVDVPDRRRLLGLMFLRQWLAIGDAIDDDAGDWADAYLESQKRGANYTCWTVRDEARVVATLLSQPGLVGTVPREEQPAGFRAFVWYVPGAEPAATRMRWRLTLCQGVLTLSTEDPESLHERRDILQAACGKDLQWLTTRWPESFSMRWFLDGGYRDWADLPEPCLEDLTPSQALRLPGFRDRVIELLKEMEFVAFYSEALEAHRSLHSRFSWLWHRLGLQRPGPPPERRLEAAAEPRPRLGLELELNMGPGVDLDQQ